MKGTAKSKAVTSGRLTGGVKVQPPRRRGTPSPGAAALPEPAYSLYSTDSEDQVISLHKGLDRCAALLSGILQAERAEDSTSISRAVKARGAKSRASLGKKIIKKLPIRAEPKASLSVQRAAASTPPRTSHHSAALAAHSGVKLHPPRRRPHTLLQPHRALPHLSSPTPTPPPSIPPSQASCPPSQPSIPPSQPSCPPSQPSIPPSQPSIPPSCPPSQPSIPPSQPSIPPSCPPSQPSIPPSQPSPPSGLLPAPQTDCKSSSEAPHVLCQVGCDGEEQELVPVRDLNSQSNATAAKPTHTWKIADVQLQRGQVGTHGSEAVTVGTVQSLLGELKAVLAGQGSVAEMLLSQLEQTLEQTLGGPSILTDPHLLSLHSQSTQLHRHVGVLNQQLKKREKTERQGNLETACPSEALTLKEELGAAQSQLQEVQDELKELRKALQDTQSQLRDTEEKNALLMTDLETTRRKLLDGEREKNEVASLTQQRLEEIGHLKRALCSRPSSAVGSSASTALPTKRVDPAEAPSDRVTQYLRSLGQLELTHTEHVLLTSGQLRDALSHDVRDEEPAEASAGHQAPPLEPPGDSRVRRHLFDSTVSQCDMASVMSDWSMRSGSTFDTRDEAAFRDGLAALDASISSLQRTIQLDLGR